MLIETKTPGRKAGSGLFRSWHQAAHYLIEGRVAPKLNGVTLGLAIAANDRDSGAIPPAYLCAC
jgi:hypothetical protein